MRYEIQNISYEPHDLDDEVIYFNFDIQFTEPEVLLIKNDFFPFSMLLDFISDKHPAFYKFIDETRSSVDGYGPCEARTMEVMGEAGVHQLYIFLEEYLMGCDWMERKFLDNKEWQSLEVNEQIKNSEQAAVAFQELDESTLGLKESQKRYLTFCETVTKQIRETAIHVYPEIANLEPEQLKEFKNIFVTEIMRMQERIEELLSKKKITCDNVIIADASLP